MSTDPFLNIDLVQETFLRLFAKGQVQHYAACTVVEGKQWTRKLSYLSSVVHELELRNAAEAIA